MSVPPVEVPAAILPCAIERHCAYSVMRAHRPELVRHLQVALLLGFAKTFDLARNDEVVIGAKVEPVLLRESLRAASDEVHMRAVGQNLLGSANRIANMFDAAHAAGAQRGAVHHAGIELHPAIHVQERPTARVKRLVVFHMHDGGFYRVKAASAFLQHRETRGRGGAHALQMRLNRVIGDRPGPAVDQHDWIRRQFRPSRRESPRRARQTRKHIRRSN